jgi:hypothetical protein
MSEGRDVITFLWSQQDIDVIKSIWSQQDRDMVKFTEYHFKSGGRPVGVPLEGEQYFGSRFFEDGYMRR